jgi:hypothetical protein
MSFFDKFLPKRLRELKVESLLAKCCIAYQEANYEDVLRFSTKVAQSISGILATVRNLHNFFLIASAVSAGTDSELVVISKRYRLGRVFFCQ